MSFRGSTFTISTGSYTARETGVVNGPWAGISVVGTIGATFDDVTVRRITNAGFALTQVVPLILGVGGYALFEAVPVAAAVP